MSNTASTRPLAPLPGDCGRLRSALSVLRRDPGSRSAQRGSIACPASVADGRFDEVVTLAHTEALAAAIPSSRLAILECAA